MIRIVRKGNNLHRNSEYYQIQINGKTFYTPEGHCSFWDEAEALRACAKHIGMVPQEKAKHVPRRNGDE